MWAGDRKRRREAGLPCGPKGRLLNSHRSWPCVMPPPNYLPLPGVDCPGQASSNSILGMSKTRSSGNSLGSTAKTALSNFTASVSWRYIVDDKGLKGLDAYKSTIR